jgi:hypothetical protein
MFITIKTLLQKAEKRRPNHFFGNIVATCFETKRIRFRAQHGTTVTRHARQENADRRRRAQVDRYECVQNSDALD